MALQPQAVNPNPLTGFMRQPKIYIKLPSGGEYWTPGALEISETGEYPVYSMTAKDEMMLKIPDALISGQAVVDVIQHCMPSIKNAWAIPNLDLDVILIAIRIATYGEKMRIPVSTPMNEFEYEIDLRTVLDQLMDQIIWDPTVQINPELIVHVKPVNYKVVSSSATKTFETQRIVQAVTSSTMTEEEKMKAFNEAVEKLNELTIGLVTNSIYKIDSSNGSTEEVKHIKEFINNADKEVFERIRSHIENLRNHNTVKPIVINPTAEMIEQGLEDKPITVPLEFDPSSFFG